MGLVPTVVLGCEWLMTAQLGTGEALVQETGRITLPLGLPSHHRRRVEYFRQFGAFVRVAKSLILCAPHCGLVLGFYKPPTERIGFHAVGLVGLRGGEKIVFLPHCAALSCTKGSLDLVQVRDEHVKVTFGKLESLSQLLDLSHSPRLVHLAAGDEEHVLQPRGALRLDLLLQPPRPFLEFLLTLVSFLSCRPSLRKKKQT